MASPVQKGKIAQWRNIQIGDSTWVVLTNHRSDLIISRDEGFEFWDSLKFTLFCLRSSNQTSATWTTVRLPRPTKTPKVSPTYRWCKSVALALWDTVSLATADSRCRTHCHTWNTCDLFWWWVCHWVVGFIFPPGQSWLVVQSYLRNHQATRSRCADEYYYCGLRTTTCLSAELWKVAAGWRPLKS